MLVKSLINIKLKVGDLKVSMKENEEFETDKKVEVVMPSQNFINTYISSEIEGDKVLLKSSEFLTCDQIDEYEDFKIISITQEVNYDQLMSNFIDNIMGNDGIYLLIILFIIVLTILMALVGSVYIFINFKFNTW